MAIKPEDMPKFLYVNLNKPTSMLTTSFEKDNLYKAYEKPQESLEKYVNVDEVCRLLDNEDIYELNKLVGNLYLPENFGEK